MDSKRNGQLSLRLEIASSLRLVDVVHGAAEEIAKLVGFDADEALNVGLAVREAVINAVKHGNEGDPQRRVAIEVEGDDAGIRVAIRDEGDGFDPASTPDPTAKENLLMPAGRGLLMMRAFVDEVEFRHEGDRGMEVVLTKRRHGEDGGSSG